MAPAEKELRLLSIRMTPENKQVDSLKAVREKREYSVF